MSQSDSTQSQPAENIKRPLDRDDPRVQDAREAEQRAYEHYDLEFREHYIDVPSVESRIRVLEVGSGPPVVLIPGDIGHGVDWTPLLPELEGYTAYVMDRPGGGLSDGVDYAAYPFRTIAARSTAALLDHFDLPTAPIMGYSMGGLFTLRFALEHPDRTSKLVLLGGPYLFPETTPPAPLRLFSLPVIGKYLISLLFQPDDPGDVREGLEFMGHPSETADGLPSAVLEAMYRMENLPGYLQTMATMTQRTTRLRGGIPDETLTPEDLQNIRSPVMLIWGRDDPMGSVAEGRAGAEHFPDAEFHEVGVGHAPWYDEPGRCGQLIRNFINRHS